MPSENVSVWWLVEPEDNCCAEKNAYRTGEVKTLRVFVSRFVARLRLADMVFFIDLRCGPSSALLQHWHDLLNDTSVD